MLELLLGGPQGFGHASRGAAAAPALANGDASAAAAAGGAGKKRKAQAGAEQALVNGVAAAAAGGSGARWLGDGVVRALLAPSGPHSCVALRQALSAGPAECTPEVR